MPIQTRTEMLATGVRSPLGVLVLGPDTAVIDRIGAEIEAALREVPGTRSAFSERIGGGYFLDFDVDRDHAARFGLNVGDVEDAVETAIGGLTVSTTIEGRERYPVTVRYATSARPVRPAGVATMDGAHIALGQVARPSCTDLHARRERQLAGYVRADTASIEITSATQSRPSSVAPPTAWRGRPVRYPERATARLAIVVPHLFLIFLLLSSTAQRWKR
jgi:Cu(I)/Ag(I) efflux system membrane protein CusA/SilA